MQRRRNCCIDGRCATEPSIRNQLAGWLEVVPQAFLLSTILCYWVRHPGKRWLTWTLSGIFVIILLLSIMGLVFTKSGIQ